MLSERITRTSNSFVHQRKSTLDRAAGGMGLVTLPRVNTIPLTFCWAFGGSLTNALLFPKCQICKVLAFAVSKVGIVIHMPHLTPS